MTGDHDTERSDPAERGHDADRRFVDALLNHHFHGNEAASSDRIAAALRQIDSASGSPVRAGAESRWLRVLPPLAAVIVIAAFLLFPTLLPNTASAAIDRAILAMSRPVDLHYRVEIETPVGVTLSGDLWFRGADFVVLRLESLAGEIWAGEGRDAAWLVPPLSSMPVRVNEKGTLLEALRIQGHVTTPFLRVSTMLERLGTSFEIEFGPDRKTIEARRIAGVPGDLPEQVMVRIAPDGIVRELTAQYSPILGPRSFRLTWLDDDPMAATFYEHAAHHDVGREVVDLR